MVPPVVIRVILCTATSPISAPAGQAAVEVELGGDLLHCREDVADVRPELELAAETGAAELGGRLGDVLAVHASREGALFPALLDRPQLDLAQVLARPDESRSDHQAGDLVAREQREVDGPLALDAGALGIVREDGADHVLARPILAQHGRAGGRVLVESRVDLPIEVVQQPCEPPLLDLAAQPLRVSPHRRFDRQHVPPQPLRLHVLHHQLPSPLSLHRISLRNRRANRSQANKDNPIENPVAKHWKAQTPKRPPERQPSAGEEGGPRGGGTPPPARPGGGAQTPPPRHSPMSPASPKGRPEGGSPPPAARPEGDSQE